MMIKKTKIIRVDEEIWKVVRRAFPNMSDSERSKLMVNTHPLVKLDQLLFQKKDILKDLGLDEDERKKRKL